MTLAKEPNGWDPGDTFRENESGLIRFLTARVGCRATAEDLAQEVFLRLKQARAADITDSRAFTFRIALNLLSNYQAQKKRRTELTDEIKDLLWSGIDEATPERQLLAQEELTRVSEVVEEMPERTRNILLWNRFDGLNRSQIAARLGISSQAVEKHLQKAVARLAEIRRIAKR